MSLIRSAVIAILLASASPLFAQFGQPTAWDVNTSRGVDTNGGAFDLGGFGSSVSSPGTDESQGAGTSVSCTVQTTTTQVVCVPALSSSTHGPGNFIGPMTGTGCTASQWNEELSQSGGTGTFTTSFGTAGSVCVGTLGGSLLTLTRANTNSVSGNTIWNSGAFTFTAALAVAQPTIQFIGYTTTHGDGGKSTWTTATNSINLVTTSSSGTSYSAQSFQNMIWSNTAASPSAALVQLTQNGTTQAWILINLKLTGFTGVVINGGTYSVSYVTVNDCEIAGITGTGSYVASGGSQTGFLRIAYSYFHGPSAGVMIAANYAPTEVAYSIIDGSTVGGAALISADSYVENHINVLNNTFYISNGGTAILLGNYTIPFIQNNIFAQASGTGTSIAGNGTSAALYQSLSYNNAYQSGTSFTYWAKSPNDITMTANPFVSPSTGNFALNSTAGGGALLAGFGAPTGYGANTATTISVGAVQSAGGTSTVKANYGWAH